MPRKAMQQRKLNPCSGKARSGGLLRKPRYLIRQESIVQPQDLSRARGKPMLEQVSILHDLGYKSEEFAKFLGRHPVDVKREVQRIEEKRQALLERMRNASTEEKVLALEGQKVRPEKIAELLRIKIERVKRIIEESREIE